MVISIESGHLEVSIVIVNINIVVIILFCNCISKIKYILKKPLTLLMGDSRDNAHRSICSWH